MASYMFEIVELADGYVGLRRAGDEGEPLIRIKFSREASNYLQESRIEVVKAMIEAGMEIFGDLAEDDASLESLLEPESRILH
ncbi:MAG: hypothetical protein GYB33_20205 [Gammaproteobacteria bacterium]|nr:hypothetical protein [Gammaproteobacteria bacterium]NHN35969.1 hypothetical protein [Pseudomaricurvus alcaniphilus]